MKPFTFKDYFSAQANAYKTFRPNYPKEMFSYMASLAPSNELVWDCACGSGQASYALADFFKTVVATDGSLQQIRNASNRSNIHFRVETAEHSSLVSKSVDLITVGQALHWFALEAFFTEAKRILKSDGVLAAWTYNSFNVTPEVDEIVKRFDKTIIGEYWPIERRFVDNDYKDIVFPFQNVITNHFTMQERWNLLQVIGFLNTWSAVQKFRDQRQSEPLDLIIDLLRHAWGDPSTYRSVRWPITIMICSMKD